MTNQWAWWQQAVAGNAGPVSDGKVESGFYRMRASKDGGWLPVAVWRDGEGKFFCRVGIKTQLASYFSEEQAAAKWTYFAKHPVSRDACIAAYESGVWPDGAPTGPARSNAPADPYEAWRAELDDKLEQVGAWLASTPIDDKTKADRARNSQAEILALIKRGEGMHKDAKAPVLEQGKEIDARYLPRCKDAKAIADKLRASYGDFAAAEEARLRREAQARFEAERAAAEAERARIAAEQQKLMAEDPIQALTSPPPALPDLPVAPVAVKVNVGGGVGRAAGLKSEWVATITDHKAALAHFAEHPDVVALVEKLAKSAVRTAKGAIEIPGVAVSERRVAA